MQLEKIPIVCKYVVDQSMALRELLKVIVSAESRMHFFELALSGSSLWLRPRPMMN